MGFKEELTARLGVHVRITRPRREKLKRYHYKIMMIDEQLSLIMTFNPTKENLHYARDFGLLIHDREITTELNQLFDADWQGKAFSPDDLPLVISPYNSREKLWRLLDSAERSIHIMDAKLQDKHLLGLLLRKAASGVEVRIISHAPLHDQVSANFQVKTLNRFKLHAKCIVVDGQFIFFGSQNLRRESLDQRREVGIIVQSVDLAQRIERIFAADWLGESEGMFVRPASPAESRVTSRI